MSDLEKRMQELDYLRPPDLWLSIEVRTNRPRTFAQRILDSLRLVSAMRVAAVAVALAAIIGVGIVVSNVGLQKIESTKQRGESGNEKGGIDESGGGSQTTEEVPLGSPESSEGSRSEENLPAGTGAGLSEPNPAPQAGPPLFYTDQADDAYGPATAPDATLSQKAFDILRVDWAPVSYVNEDGPGGYSTSITVAGAARDDGSYVSYGEFWSDVGGDCWLYHFLTPGITAFANAFCESSGDEWGFVGRVQGGPVTSTPTAAGGTRLSATFDNRAIPPLLRSAGRTLHNLSVFTCMQKAGRIDCNYYDVLDWARSTLTYRV